MHTRSTSRAATDGTSSSTTTPISGATASWTSRTGRTLLKFTGSGLRWGDLSVSNNGKGDAVVRVEGADSRVVLEGVDASLIDQSDFIF